MTLALENRIAGYLQAVRPRDGFGAELLLALNQDPHRFEPLSQLTARSRTRWLVAGAVAGVVSATGAAYLGVRRRNHRGVA